MRTRVFDELILDAVRDGARIVLNLAAGLDARPYRLALPAEVRWIEADVPGMIRFKNEALSGDPPTCTVERIALDVADFNARQGVLATVSRTGKRVLVVTEGLLVYLDAKEVGSLADDLHRHLPNAQWLLENISPEIDSNNEHSRMIFRIKAMFADEYLVDLGKKTSRGLFGAAERGYSTGGLPYGYRSEPIWGDEREPIGYRILAHEQRAAVVVRIYEMYAAGHSYLTIATTLNDELVEAPRARAKSKKKRRFKFWKKGTVRQILRNPAYVGLWSFGRRKWSKNPVTRKRYYKLRPEDQVKKQFREHLIIVPLELWEAVRVRREAVRSKYKGNPRGAPGQRTRHPFSGLLLCGLCGNGMVDAGGTRSRYYRCSAASSGGACMNRRPVRGDVLVAAAFQELRRVLLDTSLHAQLRARIEARLATFQIQSDGVRKRLVEELARLDGEVERQLHFIRAGTSLGPAGLETVSASLEKAAQERRSVKARLDALGAEPPERLPTVDEILALVLDVEARVDEDPVAAREILRELLLDGHIVMHPQDDGTYVGNSVIFPMRLRWKTRKPRPVSPARAFEVVEGGSCAGRI